MLSESLATLESILGIDLGSLAASISERIDSRTPRTPAPAADSASVVSVKGTR